MLHTNSYLRMQIQISFLQSFDRITVKDAGQEDKEKNAKSKPHAKKAGKSASVTQKVVIASETKGGGRRGRRCRRRRGFSEHLSSPAAVHAHTSDLGVRTGLFIGARRADGAQQAQRGGHGEDANHPPSAHSGVFGGDG